MSFTIFEYNTQTKDRNSFVIEKDDKQVQLRCDGNKHQFAPMSPDCVCGELNRFKDLRTK